MGFSENPVAILYFNLFPFRTLDQINISNFLLVNFIR